MFVNFAKQQTEMTHDFPLHPRAAGASRQAKVPLLLLPEHCLRQILGSGTQLVPKAQKAPRFQPPPPPATCHLLCAEGLFSP